MNKVFTNPAMQLYKFQKETFDERQDRLMTLLIPSFLFYVSKQLGLSDIQLDLSFNNVGLRTQKLYQKLGVDNIYKGGTEQIDNIKLWLSEFGIEDFNIYRDDDKEFHNFLGDTIDDLIERGLLKLENIECIECGKCNHIIDIKREDSNIKKCNLCGNQNNFITKENKQLYIDFNNLELSLKDKILNPIGKEKKHKLDMLEKNIRGKILLSKPNRIGGFNLEKYGLNEYILDPSFAISLLPIFQSLKNDSSIIIQNSGIINKILAYTHGVNNILGVEIPIYNTINKYTAPGSVKELYNSPKIDDFTFLFTRLTSELLKNGNNLTQEDILKLKRQFFAEKKRIRRSYFMFDNTLQDFLLKKNSNILQILEQIEGKKISFENKNVQDIFYTTPSKINSMEEIEEFKVYLATLIKESFLRKKMKSVIIYGSSTNRFLFNKKGKKSDIDMECLIDLESMEDYSELKKIYGKLKDKYNYDIDFTVNQPYNLLNENGYSLLKRSAKGGIVLIDNSKKSECIYGNNFAVNYYENVKGEVLFNSYEQVFKGYYDKFLKKYISNGIDNQFLKKYFYRTLITFINSLYFNYDEKKFFSQDDDFNGVLSILESFDVNKDILNILKDSSSLLNDISKKNISDDKLVINILMLLKKLDVFINNKYKNYGETKK